MRVPASPGATARRTRGVLVEGATPPFGPLVRRGGGQRWTGVRTPFASPLRGGRSLHSDPCGKALRRPESVSGDPIPVNLPQTFPWAAGRANLAFSGPSWMGKLGPGCQWASKMAGFWAAKVSGAERCPAEGVGKSESCDECQPASSGTGKQCPPGTGPERVLDNGRFCVRNRVNGIDRGDGLEINWRPGSSDCEGLPRTRRTAIRPVALLTMVCLVSASVHAETVDQGEASYLPPDGKWRRASIIVLPGKVEVLS